MELVDLQPQMRRWRPGLVIGAMADEDDPALKILAGYFEENGVGSIDTVFWEEMRSEETGIGEKKNDDCRHPDCPNM
jgi:hypothetical protein